VTGRVDAFRVDWVALLEVRQHHVEELEVPVALRPGVALPAGTTTGRIRKLPDRRQALWIDDNGVGPCFVEVKAA